MKGVVTTRGTTYDNRANLAPEFFLEIVGEYEGTRLGRQEIYADDLADVEGALWTSEMIEAARLKYMPDPRNVERVVLAVDPAVTANEGSNETGIILACRDKEGHYYVLEDLSGRLSPLAWAQRVAAVAESRRIDRVVAETNQGGDLVESNLRNVAPDLSYRAVHAKVGKRLRAEPIAALYEQGKVHHVGTLVDLEAQMTGWAPGQDSPDRLDALVYALADLKATHVAVVAPSAEPGVSRWRLPGESY
jgi:phage terminase large subunit-like protein